MNAISCRSCLTFALRIAIVAISCISAARADTFTVTKTADSGTGSLREAITDANKHPGPNTIAFDIAGGGAQTIALTSGELSIASDLTIDGSTQPGSNGAILITISGSQKLRVLNVSSGTVALNRVTISDGKSGNSGKGAGIYNSGGTLTLTDCNIAGNATGGKGGGIYNESALTVTGCAVYSNYGNYGGGVYNSGGTLTLTNCTIGDNWTAKLGGGFYIAGGSLTLTNCTLNHNEIGDLHCVGIYNDNGVVTLNNSIVANHTGGDIRGTGYTDAGHNIVEDGVGITDPTSLSGDPKLRGLGNYDGPTPTNAPLKGSIAIDAGDCAGGAVTTDQRGTARPQGDACDIGAYEIRTSFVVTTTADLGDGSLRQAIGDAELHSGPNDIVTFNIPGDGVQTITLTGKDRPIETEGSYTIDGTTQPGYAGSNLITISGGHSTRLFIINSDDTITLRALTIADGKTLYDSGGGIDAMGTLTMTNCVVTGCSSARDGGGIYSYELPLTMTNCTVSGNSAVNGGGVYTIYGTATLTDCVISENSATSNGGGLYSSSTVLLTNCTVTGNSATSNGGGIYHNHDTLTVTNCILSENSAKYGGGIDLEYATTALTNCTITGNAAGSAGGGIYNTSGQTTITNCILWGDSPKEFYGNPKSISYSDVQGGFSGTGNIKVAPIFVDASNGDLHLSAGSPCIDAADNTAVRGDITTDLDGNPRFVDDPNTNDTGNGTPPLVDMGAFEFQPPPINRGDTNCDGSINANDIDSFVTALVSHSDYQAQYPNCNYLNADINQDGSVDFNDIDGFVDCLINNGCP